MISVVRLALQGVQSFNIQAVGQRLTARIREDLFAHAINLSVRFHDRMPVGKLLTRLTSDVDALAEVFGSGAVGVLGDLVSLVVIAVTMLVVEWRLGLLLLAAQIPVTLVILWLQRRYRKANYRVREELSQLNADFQENLQGLEVVQMFRREAVNGERFNTTGLAYRRAVNGTIFFDSSISAFIEWVALGAVALVLALGGWMVTAGAMGLGTLTTFILYSQRLFDPLRQLAERFTQIQGGLTAAERIGELLEQPLEIVEDSSARPSRASLARWCSRTSASAIDPMSRSCAISPSASHRGNMSRWWVPPVPAKPPSFVCFAACTSRSRVGSFSMAAISDPSPWSICAGSWGWFCRTPSCSAAMWPTT